MNHRLTLRLQEEKQETSKQVAAQCFEERQPSFLFPQPNSLDIGDFFFGLSFFMSERERKREREKKEGNKEREKERMRGGVVNMTGEIGNLIL